MKYPVYNSKGDKVKDIDLSARMFAAPVKADVVHQVVVAQAANARVAIAHTKTKGEVSGGGKKPWKQKGTGRARHGSSRSPIWVGGGVTFGPRSNRNFSVKVNKKQKQLALAMCLSDKAAQNALAVFETLKVESGKTKDLSGWIKEIKGKLAELGQGKKFLLVLEGKDAATANAAMNLKNINTILADSLNCVELLKYDRVLMSEPAIEKIEKHYKKINEKKKDK